jgi:hypothetical protein
MERSRTKSRATRLAFAALVVLAPASASTQAPAGPIAVIAHPSCPVDSLSLAELRWLFLKVRTRWTSSKDVLVINWKAGHPIRVAFDRKVLGMSPHQVAEYWIDRRIRGLGRPPISIKSRRHIVKIIARFGGAIGYVPLKAVTGAVKVLKINGRLPSDKGYPLVLSRSPQ